MGREKGSYPFSSEARHAKKGYDPFSIRNCATRSRHSVCAALAGLSADRDLFTISSSLPHEIRSDDGLADHKALGPGHTGQRAELGVAAFDELPKQRRVQPGRGG